MYAVVVCMLYLCIFVRLSIRLSIYAIVFMPYVCLSILLYISVKIFLLKPTEEEEAVQYSSISKL